MRHKCFDLNFQRYFLSHRHLYLFLYKSDNSFDRSDIIFYFSKFRKLYRLRYAIIKISIITASIGPWSPFFFILKISGVTQSLKIITTKNIPDDPLENTLRPPWGLWPPRCESRLYGNESLYIYIYIYIFSSSFIVFPGS